MVTTATPISFIMTFILLNKCIILHSAFFLLSARKYQYFLFVLKEENQNETFYFRQRPAKFVHKGIISPSDYWKLKYLKRATQESLHTRFKFNLGHYSNRECLLLFRFTCSQIKRLQKTLKLPRKNYLSNRVSFSGIEGLCLLLRRFSYPNRLYDLTKMFGRDQTTLSRMLKYMTELIYRRHKNKMLSLSQPWIVNNLPKFADACLVAGCLFPNIVGIIDGTCRPICRPKEIQKKQYRYYKEHVLKYQSIVFPNGLIGRLDGAFNENRHDSAILHLTTCLAEMHNLFINTDGTWFSLYGDAGYANQKFIKVGFKNHAKFNEYQKQFNKDMASLRVSVEYGFGKIIQQFAFLDFRKIQKMLLQPLKKQYFVAAILTNCHTCLNGSQVSNYFGVDPPTLEQYLHQ